MSLPKLAVSRPIATIVLFAAIALMGTISFTRLNLDLMPDIEPPAISVVTPYPGASAQDVESEVTKYLEDQLSTTPNLSRLESLSKDNLSIVTTIFDWGTDLDVAVSDVREKIDLAKPYLTGDAESSFIFKFSSAMVPALIVSVTAEESTPDLYRIVDTQLAEPLKRVNGVGAIVYESGIERQINVHFDREALRAYNLSVSQVASVLKAENLDLPAGTLKTGKQELQLRVVGRFVHADEIGKVVVGKRGDAMIRLHDVATVDDDFPERAQWGWGNGTPGMVMIIQKQAGANTVEVIESLKVELDRLVRTLPSDIKVEKVIDVSRQIKLMIGNLSNSVAVGGLLVVLICFVFLRSVRSSLIISMAIPFSIIIAFIFMFFMGFTLNVMSLMSLAIAAGMVVDNAIVALENITRHVEDGEDVPTASVNGAQQVASALIAASLTTIAVFAPLIFVEGIAGIIFGQLAFMIFVTIVASLLVSFTLTPMMASKLLQNKSKAEQLKLFVWSEQVLSTLERFYGVVLHKVLQHRALTLAILTLVIAASVGLITSVGTEFMPDVDSGEIELVLELPEGTRGEVTADVTDSVFDEFAKIPEIALSYGVAGQSERGFMSAMGFDEGPNIGRVGARLIDKEERERSAKEVTDYLRPIVSKFPELENISVSSVSAMQKVFFGGGGALSLDVLGHDFEKTEKVVGQIRDILENTKGVVDISVSRKKPRPELQVILDRDKAADFGVNIATVAETLRTNYYGFDDTKFREAGDDFDIELRLKEEQRSSIREIGETSIPTMSGTTVKLSSIAKIVEAFGPVEITRKNRVRTTTIEAGLQGRILGEVVSDIQEELDKLGLPPGIYVEWSGAVDEQAEAFADLRLLLVLAILLVYMVMAAQFEDFVDPFVIMFSLPFAFVGVLWAFILTGTPLNIVSFIGLIMLSGIVVNNAIVMLDYVKKLQATGLGLENALITAGKARLRPILMTSLTTIFGMLPMALSVAEGAEIWNTLGITVIGGLTASGLVTLILVPIVYSVAHGNHRESELT